MYTFAFLSAHSPLNPTEIQVGLSLITEKDLAALVTPSFSIRQVEQDNAMLLTAIVEHDRILREAFAQTTILPLQFGTEFASEALLREHLIQQQQTYLEKLGALEHQAEYVIKIEPCVYEEPTLASDLKGRDYFLAKKQQAIAQAEWQTQQQQMHQEIIANLTAQYPQITISDNQQQFFILSDRASPLAAYLHDWHTYYSLWKFSFSDALPPYHFV
jgi:Gas vesicle synthesis protein GvpL/GvpF